MTTLLHKFEQEENSEYLNEIKDTKKEIKIKYIETQEIIYTSYFNNLLNNINKLEEVVIYKKKLIKYRELLGTKEILIDYDEFALQQEVKLSEKAERLKSFSNKLAVINDSTIAKMFRKIRKLFRKKESYNSQL